MIPKLAERIDLILTAPPASMLNSFSQASIQHETIPLRFTLSLPEKKRQLALHPLPRQRAMENYQDICPHEKRDADQCPPGRGVPYRHC